MTKGSPFSEPEGRAWGGGDPLSQGLCGFLSPSHLSLLPLTPFSAQETF